MIYSKIFTDWFFPDQWCAHGKSNFEACQNRIGNVEVSVFKGEVKQNSCGTLQFSNGLKQSDQIYTLFCNAKGDAVKLSKSTGEMDIYEVVVTGSGNHIKFADFANQPMEYG